MAGKKHMLALGGLGLCIPHQKRIAPPLAARQPPMGRAQRLMKALAFRVPKGGRIKG